MNEPNLNYMRCAYLHLVNSGSDILYLVNSGSAYYFLDYTKYRESIVSAQKIDFQTLINLHVLRATEAKKVIFGMSSVCLSVCLWTP